VSDQRRDAVLGDAIRAGKFSEARRDHYALMYDSDPAGTEAAIEIMAGGLVPAGAANDAYMDQHLTPPELARAVAAREAREDAAAIQARTAPPTPAAPAPSRVGRTAAAGKPKPTSRPAAGRLPAGPGYMESDLTPGERERIAHAKAGGKPPRFHQESD
jgi:hypothetical protein